jgi:type I restriction enzyme M protein
MTDLENLPDPDVLISEIMENLEAAMEQFVAASRT